jgi:hypothetical protein
MSDTGDASSGADAGPSSPPLQQVFPVTLYGELLDFYAAQLRLEGLNNPYPAWSELLKHAKPSFNLERFREMGPRTARANSVNALLTTMPRTEAIYARLRQLPPRMLSAIKVCNEVNLRRLRERSVLGSASRLLLSLGALLGAAKAAQEFGLVSAPDLAAFGGSVRAALPRDMAPLLWPVARVFLLLLLVMSVLNYFILIPKVGLVRALGEVIDIAIAERTGEGASK